MRLLKNLRLIIAMMLALTVSGGLALAQQDSPAPVIPWLEPANKGDAESQYIMGNAYASGMPVLGINQDPALAFKW